MPRLKSFSRRHIVLGPALLALLAKTGTGQAQALPLQGGIPMTAGRDPVSDRIRNNIALLAEDAAAVAGSDANAEAALRADADTAWRYFTTSARYGRPIPYGTAYFDKGKFQGYNGLTMWDVASILNAHVAAFAIGLISRTQLRQSTGRLIRLLQQATRSTRLGRLPCLTIELGPRKKFYAGFDSADVGRLLVSLKIVDRVFAGKSGARDLVAGWDLQRVIRDRRVVCVAGGKRVDVPTNSYTHYAGEGYRLWGFDVEDPYAGDESLKTVAQKAAFLESVSQMGRIATEPNATEIIEIGSSAAASLICDTLLAAQIQRHASLAQLTCVSEGIIDQEPWFTYQSCQVHFDKADEWLIESTDVEKSKMISSKGESLRTISTKASFLWWAVRPGHYSELLRTTAQAAAATHDIGFASNIYAATLKPTYCTDINTNAMILEAIAFMMHGRKPLLQVAGLLR